MKRVVMVGNGQSTVEEVEDIHAEQNELLIRLTYMGICMSEYDAWRTAERGLVLGHEPVGEVVAVGEQVVGFQVGDRVSGLWAQGMNEYNAVDPRKELVIKLPPSVPDEHGIVEPLACILSAVSKAEIRVPGDSVAVIGCGYMGCGAISALKLRGAYVLAIDTNPAALDKAKQYGADLCYTPQEALERFTGKDRQGISTVMEWGGNEASLDTAVQLTATCGQLCIGGYHTGGKRLVDVQSLNAKAIRVNNTHPREEDLLERCAVNSIKLLERNVWKFQNVPTMVYPAGMYDQAYKDMKSGAGKFMKAVLDMRNVSGQPKLR